MSSASSAVDENSAAAAEMRATTDLLTRTIVPISATASANASAANEAALSTRQLARGIDDIDTTARALRDQAEELNVLVSKFTIHAATRVCAEGYPGVSADRKPIEHHASVTGPTSVTR
jgi:methyl-accepting chemotaxis protein